MTHLHRGHPCTYPAPHLHWPEWRREQWSWRLDIWGMDRFGDRRHD